MSLATVRCRVRLIGLLVALPTSAWVSFAPVAARALAPDEANPMEEIIAAYDRGDYTTAAALAEAAYAENPDPTLLFSAGEAFLAAGDCEGATRSFERFLGSGPPKIDADAARQRMATCAQKEEDVRPSPPPPSAAAPDPEPPSIQPPPPIARDPLFLGTLIGGVVVAGGGAALLVASRQGATDAAFAPTEDAWEAKVAQSRGLATAGVVLVSLGGALLVGAVTRAIVLRRRRNRH